jgi:perosamine synthetase
VRRIYYAKPSITEKEIGYVADAVRNGWGENCYEYISRFEREFQDYLHIEHAMATSSCTGALHMGLAALGIGPGDEVILADINWIASAAPITYLGAKPVFVDVLADTWCIDAASAEDAVTERTKAIIAVHLYGNLCDMVALQDVAQRHKLVLIEDAAEAIGSVLQGKRAGSIGAFGTFSFHGSKTVTTGEGGMFVTRDTALYERVLSLSNHGRVRGQTRQFWPEKIGFKYKMSNIQAAIGCAQLERVQELVEAKRRIFLEYALRLRDLPVRLNPEPKGTVNGFWMPTMVVDAEAVFDRQRLLDSFKAENIDGRVFFWPLSSLPMFESVTSNTVSYSLYPRACNLPSYHDMTSDDIERVCRIIRRCIS